MKRLLSFFTLVCIGICICSCGQKEDSPISKYYGIWNLFPTEMEGVDEADVLSSVQSVAITPEYVSFGTDEFSVDSKKDLSRVYDHSVASGSNVHQYGIKETEYGYYELFDTSTQDVLICLYNEGQEFVFIPYYECACMKVTNKYPKRLSYRDDEIADKSSQNTEGKRSKIKKNASIEDVWIKLFKDDEYVCFITDIVADTRYMDSPYYFALHPFPYSENGLEGKGYFVRKKLSYDYLDYYCDYEIRGNYLRLFNVIEEYDYRSNTKNNHVKDEFYTVSRVESGIQIKGTFVDSNIETTMTLCPLPDHFRKNLDNSKWCRHR